MNYITGATVSGSASVAIEVRPTDSLLFFRPSASPTHSYVYCPAKIRVNLPDGADAELMAGGPPGGIVPTGGEYIDAWHYGGIIVS